MRNRIPKRNRRNQGLNAEGLYGMYEILEFMQYGLGYTKKEVLAAVVTWGQQNRNETGHTTQLTIIEQLEKIIGKKR